MLDFRYQDNNSTCIIYSTPIAQHRRYLHVSISLHGTTHVCVASTCTLAGVQYTRPRAGGGTYYCVDVLDDMSVAVRSIKVIRL